MCVTSEKKLLLGSQMVPWMFRWFVFLPAGGVTVCRFQHVLSQFSGHFVYSFSA